MGRLISDRISYRNHYMCSGEATSVDYRRRGRVILERLHRLVSCQLNYKLSVKMTFQDFKKLRHFFFLFLSLLPSLLPHSPCKIGRNLIITRDIIHTNLFYING